MLDSAGWITEEHQGAIVVTGSHGGAVAGRDVKAPVAAAVFNDAGIGVSEAGIKRLAILDEQNIPGLTVSHLSARIGDGMDTYESGVVSHANRNALAMGVAVGETAKKAVRTIQARLSKGPI